MAQPTISSVFFSKFGEVYLNWTIAISGVATQAPGGTIPTSGGVNRNGQAYVGLTGTGIAGLDLTGASAQGTTSSASPIKLFNALGSSDSGGEEIGQAFYPGLMPSMADLVAANNLCHIALPGSIATNAGDSNPTNNNSQYTLSNVSPSGSIRYKGPRTQALISRSLIASGETTPGHVPDIQVTGTNTVRFVCREQRIVGDVPNIMFGRQVRNLLAASNVNLTVNGSTTNSCTSVAVGGNISGSFGDYIEFTFTSPILPGQTLVLNIPAGFFEFKHPSFTNTWTSIAENTSVVNGSSFPTPSISNISVNGAGTSLVFTFNNPIALNTISSAISAALTSSLGVNRIQSFGNITGNALTVTLNVPIYTGESVSASSAIGQVRYSGSTGSDGLSAAYSSIGVINGSSVARPKPIIVSAKVVGPAAGSQNGKLIDLTFDRNIVNNSAASLLADGTYPDVNTTFTFSSIVSSTVARYVTTGQIYAGDILAVNIPAGIVRETITSNPNDVSNNFAVTNESTVAHPIPVLQSAVVSANGQSITLTFDINVVAGPNVTQLRIIAEDDSTNVTRTMLTNNPVISTNTLTLNILGTVFQSSPPSGDNPVTCDSNSLAGLVDSALAASAGQHSYIGIITAFSVTNNSTIPEPAAPVTPTFEQAEITNGGNELKIRWVDASDVAIGVRYLSGVPTVTGSTTGSVSVIFNRLETGLFENDTAVFILNPLIKQQSVDTVTLSIPASLVQSLETNTNNAASGPYTSAAASEFVNNSTLINPAPPQLPPIAQDIIIGLNGLKVGIYYDTTVSPLGGGITLDCSLSGRKTALLTATESVLSTVLVITDSIPVFIGETVFATIPEGLVVNSVSNQLSLNIVGFEAVNNSTIPVPKPPSLDTAEISSSGTILTLVFDASVVIGMGFIWIVGSKSGKHLLENTTLTPPSTLQFDIAGIVYEDEIVTVNLASSVVKDSAYEFTPNDELLNFTVTNNSTQTLPTIATGLAQETT